MTLGSLTALFGTLFILAAIPSVSVLAVTARSTAFGLVHGVFTAIGIVVGDVIFILLAILGLAVLAQALGAGFVFVQYLSGIYLIGLGISLWRSESRRASTRRDSDPSLIASFLTGLFLTLADQKAILFYLGLFPAFFDIAAMSYVDTGVVVGIAILAVGAPKILYAYIAERAGTLVSAKIYRRVNIAAGLVMITAGVVVIARA